MHTRCEESPPETERSNEQQRSTRQTQPAHAEDVAIPPAVFDVARIVLDDFGIVSRADVVKDVAELNAPESLEPRAVRIAFLIGERVMLSMDRDPLSRMQAARQPQRELEDEHERGMKIESLMRCRAMKVDRRAKHRHLRDERRHKKTDEQ